MAWVRSEYAGELAVLCTWLSALLPWSVSGVRLTLSGATVTVLNVRFVFGQFHYLSGPVEQSSAGLVQFVHEIPGFVPADQQLAGQLWVAAAGVYLLAFVGSVLYYAREEWVEERLPVDPVRALGGALGIVAVLLVASSVSFLASQLTVPVGTLIVGGFAAVLLRIERA